MPSFLIPFYFSSSLVLALTHWLHHMRGWLCGKGGRIIDADGNNVWGSECYLCGWEIQDGAKVGITHARTHAHAKPVRNQENQINAKSP